VLDKYRDDLEKDHRVDRKSDADVSDEKEIAETLSRGLKSISPGRDYASKYHDLMIGIIEFIFFPWLCNPIKEKEINSGRKRIDMVMENAARGGVFYKLHDIRKIPCAIVPLECKNYKTEVSNPELDQLAGRMSVNRGMFGFLCCRHFENRSKFIESCKDTYRDRKELIVPLDDNTIVKFLHLISEEKRKVIDRKINDLIDEVWY